MSGTPFWGRAVKDIDIATAEPPDRVVALLGAAGVKSIPTGIDHGTVTAVIDGVAFEITTLRLDVENFGRRARVAYTDDWAADAMRRDFTMNALFCDLDGTLYDPTGGLPDLKAGRVRFVGEARDRIAEDVLRLLRFFRLYAHYGTGEADRDALRACREMAPDIANLSAERIWSELKQLLRAPAPADVLTLMADWHVLVHALPEAGSREPLTNLVEIETKSATAPDPVRRLSILLERDDAGAKALRRPAAPVQCRDRAFAGPGEPARATEYRQDRRAKPRRALPAGQRYFRRSGPAGLGCRGAGR